MLTNLHLHNFKGARDLRLRLAPLTLLSGLNSAGKSTVLQALCLVRQSFGWKGMSASGPMLLRGSLIELGTFGDVISHGATSDAIQFTITTSNSAWTCEFWGGVGESFAAGTVTTGELPAELVGSDFQLLLAERVAPATRFPTRSGEGMPAGHLGAHGEYATDVLAQSILNQVHVDVGMRVERNPFVDAQYSAKAAPTSLLIDQVSAWLQLLSPGVRVRAERIPVTDDVRLVFEYVGRRGLEETGAPIRPTNVGFGLTYALPVITAALLLKPGSLLLLENPEAHLHPKGQFHLGVLLSQAVGSGIQVVVESHSDHFLNGLRLAAKYRLMTSDDVAFHFFTRDIESGDVRVESPAMLNDGSIPTWPAGFFDEWDNALSKLLQ